MSRFIHIISIIAMAVLVFSVHADNKLEMPTFEAGKKIQKIDKPVTKNKLPQTNKLNKENVYTYTATFAGSVNNTNSPAGSNMSIRWKCNKPNVCTAAGNWPVPSVQSCNQLAKNKRQEVTSYGHQTKKLSKSQLSQCNQGIETEKNTLAKNKTKKPGIHKTLTTNKSFDAKNNQNEKMLSANSSIKELTPSKSLNIEVDSGIQRPATKGLGLNKGVAATSNNVNALMQTKINSFDQLKGVKQSKNNDLENKINNSRSNAYGGYGRRIGGEDCDDTRRDANPNTTETCDGIDNNCDGRIDEGQTLPYYLDADGDTHGDPARRMDVCPDEITRAANEGRWLVPVGNDCDDADPERWNNCE